MRIPSENRVRKPMSSVYAYAIGIVSMFSGAAVWAQTGVYIQGSAEAGFRRDSLLWNIADSDGAPNILSELQWQAMDGLEVKGGGALYAGPLVLIGNAGMTYFFDGANQDSDYTGNNRTNEFSRSNNEADGRTYDVTLAVGGRFVGPAASRKTLRVAVTPMVGLSYFVQELNIFNGFQTIPAGGSFPGLASEYNTEWRLPWVGVQLEFTDDRDRSLEVGATWYAPPILPDGRYEAEANWNLINAFAHPVSFRHRADPKGYGWNAGIRWPMSTGLEFTLRIEQRLLETDAGLDITYLSDGSSDQTRLNEVRWDSLTWLRIGIQTRRR